MNDQSGKIELPLRFYDVLARISLRIADDELKRRAAAKAAAETQDQPAESAS